MTDFEREDLELKAVMGDKFVDATMESAGTEKPTEKPVAKPVGTGEHKPAKNVLTEEKPANDLWKPVKPAPNFMEKLKQTVIDVWLYAALSLVLFWWQQTGLLEETTAWYALLVCVGMVFFTVGKNWRGWCE